MDILKMIENGEPLTDSQILSSNCSTIDVIRAYENKTREAVAQYDKVLRTYEITYLDENGHEVDSKILEYGSSVNQNIDPPQKKGNLL